MDEEQLMREILRDEGPDELRAARLGLLSDQAITGEGKDGGKALGSGYQDHPTAQAVDASISHAPENDAGYDPDHSGMHKSFGLSPILKGDIPSTTEGQSGEGISLTSPMFREDLHLAADSYGLNHWSSCNCRSVCISSCSR